MISGEETDMYPHFQRFFALVRDYCQLNPRQLGPSLRHEITVHQADPKLVRVILENSPNLELIDLRSFQKGSYQGELIRSLEGIRKGKTLDDVRGFLSELKQFTYSYQDEEKLAETQEMINASNYNGRVMMLCRSNSTEDHFKTMLRIKNPLVLQLYPMELNNSMVKVLGGLHPVLEVILEKGVKLGDPELFVEVLNGSQKLKFVKINRWETPSDLDLLKTCMKRFILKHTRISPDSLATILNNNPLVENLKLLFCEITNEHLALLPHQKQTKMRVLELRDFKTTDFNFSGVKSIVEKYPSLIELTLISILIGNKAVIHISTLQSLQTINLICCYLKDSGLIYLKKIKTLKRIDITNGNQVSLNISLQVYKNARRLWYSPDLALQEDMSEPGMTKQFQNIYLGLDVRWQ